MCRAFVTSVLTLTVYKLKSRSWGGWWIVSDSIGREFSPYVGCRGGLYEQSDSVLERGKVEVWSGSPTPDGSSLSWGEERTRGRDGKDGLDPKRGRHFLSMDDSLWLNVWRLHIYSKDYPDRRVTEVRPNPHFPLNSDLHVFFSRSNILSLVVFVSVGFRDPSSLPDWTKSLQFTERSPVCRSLAFSILLESITNVKIVRDLLMLGVGGWNQTLYEIRGDDIPTSSHPYMNPYPSRKPKQRTFN